MNISVLSGFARYGLACAILLSSSPCFAAVVGHEKPEKVFVVDNHKEALCHWYREGVKGMTLVHIDAQDDLYFDELSLSMDADGMRKVLSSDGCSEPENGLRLLSEADEPFNQDDFIFAAYRLGMIDELYWVVPSKDPMPASQFDLYKEKMRQSFPVDFVDSLIFGEAMITGNFQGLPVIIVTLDQLPALDSPVLVDIDVDYLTALYENPVKEGLLKITGWFFGKLKGKKVNSELVTVSASGGWSATPMRLAYLGEYITRIVTDPGNLETGPPEPWRVQDNIEYLNFMLAKDEAIALSSQLGKMLPDSPLPHYDLAIIAAERGNVEESLDHLARSVERDRDYRYGYIELANVFAGLGRMEDAFAVLKRGSERHPDFTELIIMYGSYSLQLDEFPGAAAAFERARAQNSNVAVIHSGLAFAQFNMGMEKKAEKNMEKFRAMARPGGNTRAILGEWDRLKSGQRSLN